MFAVYVEKAKWRVGCTSDRYDVARNVISKPRIEGVCVKAGGMLDLLSIKSAICDDKVSPPTSTYLKAHSRARTWPDFYCVMDC